MLSNQDKELRNNVSVQFFLNEVLDFMLLTKNPLLTFRPNGEAQINNVVEACAQYCGFMAKVTEAGFEAANWRKHLDLMKETK